MSDATIDPATFAELRASAGEDFVKELVDTFLEEAPGMLAALRTAHGIGDAHAFRRAAHSLKSNAHTFGATAPGACARTLERQGQPVDVAALDATDAAYGRTAALTALRDA